jgi:Transposase
VVIDRGARRNARLPEQRRRAIEVVSIDPYEAYRQAIRNELPWARIVVDHFHLVHGANTALDSVRRERQREAGMRRHPKRVRRSGKGASWRQDLYRARHRLLKARERLTERERRRLIALFEHEPLIAEAWGLKEAFRWIYRSPDRHEAERRLEHFLAAVERAQLSAFTAFADGVALARRTARLLRRADHQRLCRRRHQQGQGHQAPRLRTTHMRIVVRRGARVRWTAPRGTVNACWGRRATVERSSSRSIISSPSRTRRTRPGRRACASGTHLRRRPGVPPRR